ncbi:Lon protease family protein [Clostridium scatologenes]|uniref:endopeptidase La n=1 Tax=Clostridium scatologenes TaxID=1548 RepID=A0A0E3M5Q1_CLOSL|nr:ATP-binding protein [Clostridium scatologenes]AKA68415.1 peptidase S16, lon domain-containing protein [Clostridium scatologenes]
MKQYSELTRKDLELQFNEMPDFDTTCDVESYNMVIGQKRAVESIELGLNMDSKQYNIFISGKTGTGKTGYIVRKIEEYAKKMPTPQDWCYVYNFENPNNPVAISLNTGTAIKFKEGMNFFIKYIIKEVPVYFDSENYENEKNSIIGKYENMLLDLSRELNIEAKKRGFSVKKTPTGEFVFIALKNDKQLSDDEYENLTDEERKIIENSISELRNISSDIFKQSNQVQKKLESELKYLDDKIAENIISEKIKELINSYGCSEKVIYYLNAVKEDIIENISYFFEEDVNNEEVKNVKRLFLKRYEVNVLVDNSESEGAPVIFADSAAQGKVFGNIEYENKMGSLITDFTLIKPGYLHKANGGYIIIKAQQLLTQPSSWELLKKCVNLENISINNSKYNIDVLPISTLSPEEIPLKIKVILIGSNYIYSALLNNDLEFEKIFKIKAEFDNEIEKDRDNVTNLLGLLNYYINENNLNHIRREGVKRLLQFSSRLAESKDNFSASMSNLFKIVDIANYYAKKDKSEIVEDKHVSAALKEQESMHGLIRKKILDMYKKKKYITVLKGTRVGQINGLSVSDYGDCVIGQQHRITVSTFAGRNGIINIEREADMSGNIHSKGVMILAGFVGQLVGRDIPISFNANIVFEQLYSGIEGDSASAAELLALLSSLSEIPINQSIAITGSVNQRGEIQPIGGVNDKIEGFFDICSLDGLDGTHGVIIPNTNVDDLVLKQEVLEAVEEEKFHIYSVSTICDCIQILFSDENINASHKNVLEYVKQKMLKTLKEYNNILKEAKIN